MGLAAGAGRPFGFLSLLGSGRGGWREGGESRCLQRSPSFASVSPGATPVHRECSHFTVLKAQGKRRCPRLPPLRFCHCQCPRSHLPRRVPRLEGPGCGFSQGALSRPALEAPAAPWLWSTKGAMLFFSRWLPQCYVRPGHGNNYCGGKKSVAGQI